MDKDTSAITPRREGSATAGLLDHRYPAGTFAGLIGTPFVTAPLRGLLGDAGVFRAVGGLLVLAGLYFVAPRQHREVRAAL